MKVEVKIPNAEFNLLQLTSRQVSLVVTALLEKINKTDGDTAEYVELKFLIDTIEEMVSKVDRL